MPLSAEEQRRLAELEEALSTDDLDFARSFSRRASATCPHPSRNALEQRRMQHRRARRRQILLGSVMVLLGLAGYDPETVSIETVESLIPQIASSGRLPFAGGREIPFDIESDIRFLPRTVLSYHVNALTITAYAGESLILERTYYSVGGGFVMNVYPRALSLLDGRTAFGAMRAIGPIDRRGCSRQ